MLETTRADARPHPRSQKEADCGCAGIFNAPTAVETYVQVFEEEDSLENFEAFASLNGPQFYGLEPNKAIITLTRKAPQEEAPIIVSGEQVIPFRTDQRLYWSIAYA